MQSLTLKKSFFKPLKQKLLIFLHVGHINSKTHHSVI